MNRLISYRKLEFLSLFIILPLLLAIPVNIWIRFSIGLIGVGYVFWISFREKYFSLQLKSIDIKRSTWLFLLFKFVFISLVTTIIVTLYYPNQLFQTPLDQPFKFLVICVVYTLGSVIPQEFIYRYFYKKRYFKLFKNDKLFIFINGILFSLAHLFFYNALVMLMTLLGGWIFAYTYLKTKSLRFTILEHLLYGCWLYAVGLGSILGFPN